MGVGASDLSMVKVPKKTTRPGNREDQRERSHEKRSTRPQNLPTTTPRVTPLTTRSPQLALISRVGGQSEIRTVRRNNREERVNVIERRPGIPHDLQPQFQTRNPQAGPRTNRNVEPRIEERRPSPYEDDDEQDADLATAIAASLAYQNSHYQVRTPSLYDDNRGWHPHRATSSGNPRQSPSTAGATIHPRNDASNNTRRSDHRGNRSIAENLPREPQPTSMAEWFDNRALSPAEEVSRRILPRNNENRSGTPTIPVWPSPQGYHEIGDQSRSATRRTSAARSETFYTAHETPIVIERAPSNTGESSNARDEAAYRA